MSWGEVKKINSDLSVPLDERAGYFAGVMPRNIEKKTISGQGSTVSSGNSGETKTVTDTDRVILEINGGVAIIKAEVYVTGKNGTYGGTSGGTATASIYVDDTLIATGSVTGNMANATKTVFSVNIDEPLSSAEIKNTPIIAKEKVVVKLTASCWAHTSDKNMDWASATSGANITYGLLP